MISGALRQTMKAFASARLATLLLLLVGAWSALGSLVPQGAASDPTVAAWASAHPQVWPAVAFLGLNQAFSAPAFLLCALVLALSTAVCAWQRTKVAVGRSRALRAAATIDQRTLASDHTLEIACDPALTEADALRIAGETLRGLGIRVKSRGGVLAAVSPTWSAWGSPVFHWALLALIVAMPLGTLVRSSGQMGVAVGQVKADDPSSYGVLTAGPWHSWAPRSIRVDAFDVNFKSGGVNRGPSPTVSVLDAQGTVVATQRVYPNMTLKTGSLTIYPADYGLAAVVSLVDTGGVEATRSVQLLDFSGKAEGGTAPVTPLILGDPQGADQLKVVVSVPLDRAQRGYLGRLPDVLRARIVVASPDGDVLLDKVLLPGEDLPLPSGGALRLIGVGYYARLQLVDDPSIPLLYAAVVVALLGLCVSTLARQQVVLAAVTQAVDGIRIVVRVRLWRNASSSRDEIETELTRALGGTDEGRPA